MSNQFKGKPANKTAVPSLEENADRFYNTIKYKDLNSNRKLFFNVCVVFLIIMGLITLFSLKFSYDTFFKPTPVIAFDKEGKRLSFASNEVLDPGPSKIRLEQFLKLFINNFEGVSPDIEKNLTTAYNMLTKKYREILLAKGVHTEKINAWKDKNYKTDTEISILKIVSGELKMGSQIIVEGIGKMYFSPAVKPQDNQNYTETRYFYFSTVIKITPVSYEISPDGMLINLFSSKGFEDELKFKAYLMENKKEYLLENNKDKGVAQ